MAESEMDLKTACDWAASYVTRNVRPWEKVEQVLRVALAAEDRARVATDATAKAQRDLEQYRSELATAREADAKALETQKQATTLRLAELRAKVQEADRAAEARLETLTRELDRAQREHDAMLESLTRERTTVTAETTQAIAAVRAEHVKAQNAYNDFRVSIGLPTT